MLDALRRWLNLGGAPPGWAEFDPWADANQWTIKRTIAHDGWAMDHNPQHAGWRIEWGPAQRSFMSSHEFRIRFEVAQNSEVQALLLDRPLLARLDHEVYAQFTDNVQTRLDEETPEEMRWLVGGVAAALKQRAEAMPIEAVSAEPFILRLARGQVVIRQAATPPRVQVLETCVAVAEAVEEALRKSA